MKTIFRWLLAGFLFMFLTGMSRAPSGPAQQKTVQVKQGAARQHDGHRTEKPHAKIDLEYTVDKTYVLDVPVRVALTVVNGRDAEDVKVSFTVDDGLILNSADNAIGFGAAAAGSRHGFEVQITPQQNGLFYVNVFASMLVDGKYQSRAFAVPVSVGDYDPKQLHKPVGVISVDSKGERVISMPARESTDPR